MRCDAEIFCLREVGKKVEVENTFVCNACTFEYLFSIKTNISFETHKIFSGACV